MKKQKHVFVRMLSLALAAAIFPGAVPTVSLAEDLTFSKLSDAVDYVCRCAEQRKSECFFYITDPQVASWDLEELLREFIECSGFVVWLSISRKEVSPGKFRIGLWPIYRPGVRMADAWKSGNTGGLNSDEKKALDHAERVARSIRSRYASDLDREIAVHDYLCKILTYEETDTGYDIAPQHLATYALNTGKANCQGYSDAFYLLGTLAGLNVRIQGGENRNGGHAWNAVELDGEWYMLDVTVNDADGNVLAPEAPCYIYFNMGRDLLAACGYTWKSTWESADIADYTDGNYFFYHGGGDSLPLFFQLRRGCDRACSLLPGHDIISS